MKTYNQMTTLRTDRKFVPVDDYERDEKGNIKRFVYVVLRLSLTLHVETKILLRITMLKNKEFERSL